MRTWLPDLWVVASIGAGIIIGVVFDEWMPGSLGWLTYVLIVTTILISAHELWQRRKR